jgi:hypothetical protein
MSTFAPALPSVTPLDPRKHVNFTRGMVLGVDDFDQEFAYLSGRDRWMVRDLAGYGVVSGLRLSVGPPPDGEEDRGPRLAVSQGVAALPSGQLVCVEPAQCAFLGEWADANREELEGRSPAGDVRVAVVLCYADCPTDDVPIPGEPCRSEEDLMAPSRVRDSFSLELRLDPPEHREEQAVRRLGAWLASVPLADGGTDLDVFLDELRTAAAGLDDSPPGSPPGDGPAGSPPAGLAIPRDRASEYLEAAFAVWVGELRDACRAEVPGCGCGPGPAGPPEDPCLLLGEVTFPLTWDALSGELVVGDAEDVEIDLALRPSLLHARLLQEWLVQGGGRGADATAPGPVAAASASVVVRVDAPSLEVTGGGLTVERIDDRIFHLVPDVVIAGAEYVVTGTAISGVADARPLTFEILDETDSDLADLRNNAGIEEPGVTVRVQTADGDPAKRGFALRVEPSGGAA